MYLYDKWCSHYFLSGCTCSFGSSLMCLRLELLKLASVPSNP